MRERPTEVRERPAPVLVDRLPTPTVTINADLPASGKSAFEGYAFGGLDGLGTGTGEGNGPGSGGGSGNAAGRSDRSVKIGLAQWLRTPTPRDFRAAWPARARDEWHPPAEVRLLCGVIRDGRAKDCHILSEQPADWGFGAASLKLVAASRIRPVVVDGLYADLPVVVPVRFVSLLKRKLRSPRDPAPRATASPPPS